MAPFLYKDQRVSYNGHYVTFPRLRREFDSLYPHHVSIDEIGQKPYNRKQRMPISRKFLHDKFILSLVSINVFAALVCIIFVLLRFGADSNSNGYIVQYRANLGISAFKTGDLSSILSFTLFAPLVAVINTILSIRMYSIKRQLAIAVLFLGILLIALAIIVSNALLVLR